jgi:hypothetical protein
MFKQLQQLLEAVGLNFTLLLAGAIGTWVGMKNGQPWWVQAITVFTGAFIANYTAPVVVDLFGMSAGSVGGVGFLTGYMGKQGLEFIIEKFKKDGKSKTN